MGVYTRKTEIILVRKINVDNKILCLPQVTSPRKKKLMLICYEL